MPSWTRNSYFSLYSIEMLVIPNFFFFTLYNQNFSLITISGDEKIAISKSRFITLGFISRMTLRSDLMKTFSLNNKLEAEDCESILNLLERIQELINSRDDFEQSAKVEVFNMFQHYAHNYIMLGIGYANVSIIFGFFSYRKEYDFIENQNDVAKERIK